MKQAKYIHHYTEEEVGMTYKVLPFIQDHTRNGIRLAFTLAVMALALASVGSAQAKPSAGTWVDCASQSDIPTAECDALVALYDGTTGASWTTSTDWKATDTPCSWYGVT